MLAARIRAEQPGPSIHLENKTRATGNIAQVPTVSIPCWKTDSLRSHSPLLPMLRSAVVNLGSVEQ